MTALETAWAAFLKTVPDRHELSVHTLDRERCGT